MPLRSLLMHAGFSAEQAIQICGGTQLSLISAGTTQLTAAQLPNSVNVFGTVGASSGCILRNDLSVGEEQIVVNATATTLSIYPPVGGSINGGSVNAAITLVGNKRADFICTLSGLNFHYTITS